MYQELQDLPQKYNVVALSKMNKVRATQLMTLRKKFHDQIHIKIIKNKVAQRAFEKVSKIPGIEDLSKELEGQCALMFTDLSPFKLNLIFSENKVFLPAKGGDFGNNSPLIFPASRFLVQREKLAHFLVVSSQQRQGVLLLRGSGILAGDCHFSIQNMEWLVNK